MTAPRRPKETRDGRSRPQDGPEGTQKGPIVSAITCSAQPLGNDGGSVKRGPGAKCSPVEWRIPRVLCTPQTIVSPHLKIDAVITKPIAISSQKHRTVTRDARQTAASPRLPFIPLHFGDLSAANLDPIEKDRRLSSELNVSVLRLAGPPLALRGEPKASERRADAQAAADRLAKSID